MLPAHPPLPTAWNLPFQFSAGSHTSISICESEDGFSTACTRQCAGSIVCGVVGPCPRPPAGAPRPPACAFGATGPPGGPCCAGGVNGPAGTSCADMIVVFGSASDASLSQDGGAVCAARSMTLR